MNVTKMKKARDLIRDTLKSGKTLSDKERRLIIQYCEKMKVNPNMVLRRLTKCLGCKCHNET